MSLVNSLAGQHVLIIDDEADNLTPLRLVLEFQNAHVELASNGREALKLLETRTPDLILIDLSMPELNGWETFKMIREGRLAATAQVFAMTAHAMQGDREKVLEAGFDGYISKPFRPTTIADEIQTALADAASFRSPV